VSGTDCCPFCRLPQERIVLQNDLALVIRDGYPVSPGHTLIIPKRHVGSFFDVTEQERASLLSLLDQAKADLETEFSPAGYNIGINLFSSVGAIEIAANSCLTGVCGK
jgi:diadenosine tetraphosphate (Ap4A) HIT family hydrolase